MIKVAARRVVTIARPSRRSRRRTRKGCSPRSKTNGRSLTLGVAGMGVTTERLRPFRAHNGMTATARSPVLPEATLLGALSAQPRRPRSRRAVSASRPHSRDSNGVVVRLKPSRRVKAGVLGFDPSRAWHSRADHPPFRHSRQPVAHRQAAVVAIREPSARRPTATSRFLPASSG